MLTCETCGGSDFFNEAGFMYCSSCQTQSQKYYEQDSELPGFVSHVKQKPKKKKETLDKKYMRVEDLWTSWDAFNYILFGMTQELQSLSFAPKNLKETVLQLWACQLQKSEVAFTSRMNEIKPKLGLLYRHRDSEVLYGFAHLFPKKRQKRKRTSSRLDRSASLIKKKFFDKQFEDYSGSQSSTGYLSDSIETLAPSSSRSGSASESEGTTPGSLRNVFSLSDNVTYKKLKKVPTLKYSKRIKVNYFCKSKLLSILHLALLLNGSAIQLGDVLRFIRESHLSFAKVSHFLPDEFQLSKGDIPFIETVRDNNMPTHLKQRKVGRNLARSLGVNEVCFPDMPALVNRYCVELNLPDIVPRYSLTVLKHVGMEKIYLLKRTQYLPNFEALALASIIFVMKLLFGFDGITELILSDLAEKINSCVKSVSGKKFFVFNAWQKHIECRKALLEVLHYPTEEKLMSSSIGNSRGYLDVVVKESRDERKEKRFKKYIQYHLDPKVVDPVKEVLESLAEPVDHNRLDFPPSLTPCSTYLDIILEIYQEGRENARLKYEELPELSSTAMDILNEKFKEQSVDYLLRPKIYKKILTGENFRIIEKSKSDLINIKIISESTENSEFETISKEDVESIKFPQFSKSKNVVFIKNPFDYWILKHTRDEKLLYQFKSGVFTKMSVNFRWFLLECSSMLEMNTRELYKELTFVENRMKAFVQRITNSRS